MFGSVVQSFYSIIAVLILEDKLSGLDKLSYDYGYTYYYGQLTWLFGVVITLFYGHMIMS